MSEKASLSAPGESSTPQSSAEYWRRFEGQRLKTFMEAHGSVKLELPGGARYVISLFPLADPLPHARTAEASKGFFRDAEIGRAHV